MIEPPQEDLTQLPPDVMIRVDTHTVPSSRVENKLVEVSFTCHGSLNTNIARFLITLDSSKLAEEREVDYKPLMTLDYKELERPIYPIAEVLDSEP